MTGYGVEVVLPRGGGRVRLVEGVEVEDQIALNGRLSNAVQDVLGRVRVYPLLGGGLDVETCSSADRKIHMTHHEVVFDPPGSEGFWQPFFQVRRGPPPLLAFSDGTEIEIVGYST